MEEEIKQNSCLNDVRQEIEALIQMKIKTCQEAGSKYYLAKLKKIIDGQKLCEKLNATHTSLYCYIDRSIHSQKVWHLNIVLNDKYTLVYRIDNVVPKAKDCEKVLKFAQDIKDKLYTLAEAKRMISGNSSYKGIIRNHKPHF